MSDDWKCVWPEGCTTGRPYHARDMCSTHYMKWYKSQDRNNGICSIKICDRDIGSDGARGWCAGHYQRWYLTGDVQAHIPFMPIGQPTTLRQMTSTEMKWLAGWLEGEGAFAPGNRGGYKAIRVSAKSIDLDVLEHVYELTGVGHIRSNKPSTSRAKPIWSWSVTRREDVVALMETLIPLMHSRRKARMTEVLNWAQWWSAWGVNPSPRFEDGDSIAERKKDTV